MDIEYIKKTTYKKIKEEYKNYEITDIYKTYDMLNKKEKIYDDDKDIIKNKKLDINKYPYIRYCKNILKEMVNNIDVNIKNKYIYPDYNNINFTQENINKMEFNIPIINIDEDCNNNDFKLTSYQIFLKNFISNNTPYNSILLYHGTGTGKTCSAISIAENFRDIYSREKNKIIILSPGKVEQGWYKNIYNPLINNKQCTKDTYKNLTKKRKVNEKYNIEFDRNQMINKYYSFYGYLEFANKIKNIINKNGEIEGQKIIYNLYSNRVLIIDEAHNIRKSKAIDLDEEDKTIETEETEKKEKYRSIEYIEKVLKYTKNMKLILLTATPMFDKSEEIIDLINLLLLNDKRTIMKNIFNNGLLIDEETFKKKTIGYISYIKGETSNKFPEKIISIENKYIDEELNDLSLYECKMSNTQSEYYYKIYEQIKNKRKIHVDSILKQISNIVYPSKSTNIKSYYGENGLKEIFTIADNKYKYKNVEKIFKLDNLKKYSAKIYNIIKKIEKSEGIIFIYSQYIKSGILPLILALEQNGYSNYSNNNILDDDDIRYNGKKYISITSENYLSKNNENELKELVKDNLNGEKIKIVLGSNVASEGLDLKNIREIYILDPWYNLKKVQQIIGRGIRYCSHENLPIEKRNVTVYLYVSTTEKKEDIDIEIYKLANKKNKQIINIEEKLQKNAIDYELFKEINYNEKKKAYTINKNTLKHNTLKNLYDIYENKIINMFKNKINIDINEIKNSIDNSIDNVDIDLLKLTIRNIVNNKINITYKNNNGYLLLINNYLIYQPYENNELSSIYDRENIENNKFVDKYTNLDIIKIIDTKEIEKSDIYVIIEKIKNLYNDIPKIIGCENDIDGFTDNIKYDYIIERLTYTEKQTLLENTIDDKLIDIELNIDIDDFKKIVIDHFRPNFLNQKNEMIINDQNEISNEFIIPNGYILFGEKNVPIITIKSEGKYIEANKIDEKKIKNDIKKYKYIFPNYYTFNKDINKLQIYDGNKTYHCERKNNQVTNNEYRIDMFKKNNLIEYEKYIKLFDNHNIQQLCNFIEILLRIKSKRENIKYHFNYDNYFVYKLCKNQ